MTNHLFATFPEDGLDESILFRLTRADAPNILLCCAYVARCLRGATNVFERLRQIEPDVHTPTRDELTAWIAAHPHLPELLGDDVLLLGVDRYLLSEPQNSPEPILLHLYDVYSEAWSAHPFDARGSTEDLLRYVRTMPMRRVIIPLAWLERRVQDAVSATNAYRHESKKP